VKPVNTSNKFA
jgi:hypothetical protein